MLIAILYKSTDKLKGQVKVQESRSDLRSVSLLYRKLKLPSPSVQAKRCKLTLTIMSILLPTHRVR